MSLPPHPIGFHTSDVRRFSGLSNLLVDDGIICPEDAEAAENIAQRQGLRVADVLTSRFGIAKLTIAQTFSTLYQCQLINPCDSSSDPTLLDEFGPTKAIRSGILPWRRMGSTTIILTDKPDQFDKFHADLTKQFGPCRMAITTRDLLETSVVATHRDWLCFDAETKVAANFSSRTWNAQRALRWGIGGLAALTGAAIVFPQITVIALCALASTILILNMGVKACAAVIGFNHQLTPHQVTAARLPHITLLIPLFRETEIAQHLLSRLRSIDYPRELLDICLVTESDDTTTRDALGKTVLPTWMRPIVVPQGTLRTKPRALNFALDFARGSIIGVYDAEDAPDPDQLQIVAHHFANRGPSVACLQGVLDYYNDSANWLTRCFTIEYASWFRVILPGLERMGLVVPLGGTTLFFRRDVLEELGGWDAHNVTEDADLGVRLARAGYTTELIPTVTQEEANGRFWPWIKQRSRWLKGYAITYTVHMREPRKLWRDLGAKRFWGVQLLFAGTLSQFVLAPVLWSFWLIPLGWHHPFHDTLPTAWFWILAITFFVAEAINLAVAAIALRAANKTWLIKWALTLQIYFPMAAIAAYKGLIELAWKPFFWDKTTHGILLPKGSIPPLAHPISDE